MILNLKKINLEKDQKHHTNEKRNMKNYVDFSFYNSCFGILFFFIEFSYIGLDINQQKGLKNPQVVQS